MVTLGRRVVILAACAACVFAVCGRLAAEDRPAISSRQDFFRYAKGLPFGISEDDDYAKVLGKIRKFLEDYKPGSKEESHCLRAVKQALIGCETGGFGIGAVLVNPNGEVVEEAHNEMIQQGRSDLHGEMNLLDKAETDRKVPLLGRFQIPEGFVVFSSAEPCPMCMIRLASAGVDTVYVVGNDADSMTRSIYKLPAFWRDICSKRSFKQAQCGAALSDAAYLLFYSIVFINDEVFKK
jgi:tRNA(Arg) A34 adenosine deaminase TadA